MASSRSSGGNSWRAVEGMAAEEGGGIMTSSGRWVRQGGQIIVLDVVPGRQSEWVARDAELEEEIVPYGCSPCIFGWRICHRP
jgi:hypothetical protein